MAQLVVAAAGAAIGGWISGGIFTAAGTLTLGAKLGWLGGSVVGGSFSPSTTESDTKEEKPEATDVAT